MPSRVASDKGGSFRYRSTPESDSVVQIGPIRTRAFRREARNSVSRAFLVGLVGALRRGSPVDRICAVDGRLDATRAPNVLAKLSQWGSSPSACVATFSL